MSAKLSNVDLQYQFLEGLLESIHNPLAVAWLQDLHTGKEIPSLDAMVEALALSSASTEAKTKRAMNLRPAAPATAPTGGKKQIPRARPCQFCQGPHWDKDCSSPPLHAIRLLVIVQGNAQTVLHATRRREQKKVLKHDRTFC